MSMETKIEKTVQWIRETVTGAGCRGVVVGLSGGIDSAVVGFLAKRAFPDDSLGVLLPCKSHPRDKACALELAAAAELDHIEVDLTQAHEVLYAGIMAALGSRADEKNMRIADANLRARLRMSTLYAIANNRGYLVSGTDNAAEVYTGYFTKYGDGGVDFLPIANLLKREVYAWGRHFGVPESILHRPPTAGLWDGQTDEGEMGTTYDRIDDLLEGKPIPEKDRQIIERLHRLTEHKRALPPAPPAF